MTTRELERALLESAGYSVVTAVDGMHAWELLQTQPVDVLVSDVSMPRMDGIALCTAIRESTRWAALPVVLVTSLASEDDRRRGLDAGADAYLTKSGLGRSELLATLERLL
jgi:two-component system chemotaxis sensor kinase CheA